MTPFAYLDPQYSELARCELGGIPREECVTYRNAC
jgi:hypothetical protein